MKNKIIMAVVLIILVVAAFVLCINKHSDLLTEKTTGESTTTTEVISSFDLSDYSFEIENYPYDKNVGPVNAREVAIEKFNEIGNEEYGYMYPFGERPVYVAYDSKNECWLLQGTLADETMDGTVPCALIHCDGTVLALWIP